MNLRIFVSDGFTVAAIRGDFDAAAVRAIRPQLEQLVAESSGDIAVDLSAAEFIDSSGIGSLVFLYKRLVAAGRRMVLVGLSGQPLETLRMLRIDRSIETLTSLSAPSSSAPSTQPLSAR